MSVVYRLYSRYINILRSFLVNSYCRTQNNLLTLKRNLADWKYVHSSPEEYVSLNINTLFDRDKNRDSVDILTIAFNNSETIRVQHNYLEDNILDKFCYIVVDNSTDNEASKSIYNYCKNHNIVYLRLENNPYNGIDPSRSHGIALNWAYRNLIKKSNAKYFGTVDHDIYPIRKTQIVKLIKENNVWGHYQQRKLGWYLWPGFSFFDKSIIIDKKVNFLPAPGIDTGGSNWESIYKYINKNAIKWPSHRYIRYGKGAVIQNSHVELIGDWLHLINTSGWKDGKIKKNIKEFINKKILKVNTK